MHGTRARRLTVAPLVVMAVLLGSCGGDSGGGQSGRDTAASPDDVDRAADIRIGLHYGWSSFGDPHRGLSEGDALWLRPIYERLLTFVQTPEGGIELAPQLATSYEVAEDGTAVTFELRDDVAFHDGTPFDAEAVKANFERAMGPDSTVAGAFESVDQIEVVDDHRVTLHLSRPDPQLPWALSWGLPGLIVSPAAFDTDLQTTPVGTGPYTLASMEKDGDAVYTRWDDHWDPDAALVETLTLSTVFEGNARYNGLRRGEFDAVYLTTPLDVESRALEDEGYHWVQGMSPFSLGLMLNSDEAPFDDPQVRRAANLALNRTEISEQLLEDLLPPTSQAFNVEYLGHDPDIPVDPYDPEEARRLVEDAGAVGASFDIVHSTALPQASMAQISQQALAEIGLEARLVPVSPSEALPTWREGQHAAMLGHITGQPEPSMTLDLSYLPGDNPPSNNPARSVDPELEALAEEGLQLPVGSDEREQHYQEIAQYLYENPVHVPIAQFSSVTVCRPEVVGCEQLFDIGRMEFRGIGLTAGT
jgi:peptide/nickel transport system substrate-binding protein